jgi:hypothetical protein
MTPDQLKAIYKDEFSVYRREVSSALDAKLHILVVHLYVEHLLERLLSVNLKKTDHLFGKNGLSFEKKLLLVESMSSLNAQRIDGIRKLNTIRNDCVHKFMYNPTETELDEFGRTLGKPYADIKRKYGKNIDGRTRAACAFLCGQVLRTVVDAEHKDS